jgi:hypothetical protein|tara:strand:+ start:12235 stop:12477 length:243 start_codon:yes stop_codon:yes gene_type:complete
MINNYKLVSWYKRLNFRIKSLFWVNIVLTFSFTFWEANLNIKEATTLVEYSIGLIARGNQLVLVFFVANFFNFSVDKYKS